MTSQQILRSSLLDILFENRNKHYGAYALRKAYPQRLGFALAIALSAVFLLYLVKPDFKNEIQKAFGPLADTVRIIDVIIPIEPPAVAQPPQASPAPAATQAHTAIDIVPDHTPIDNPVPTTGQIENVAIGAVTRPGGEGPVLPEAPITSTGPAASQTISATVFDPVEKQPEFPGGQQAWLQFLSRYLQAPDELSPGERKTVQVRFVVGEDGSVAGFEVVQSGGNAFDKEVIRVLKKMPKWKPAIQNGHHIAVSFTQPVTFVAAEE